MCARTLGGSMPNASFETMRTLVFLSLLAPLSIAAWDVRADQLECVAEQDAVRAAALLPEGAIMLEFCSHCTAPVVVVRVDKTRVFHDCDYQVAVTGLALAQTKEEFSSGYVAQRAHFSTRNERYERGIDLAYAYVE